jgi:hypothetical protein
MTFSQTTQLDARKGSVWRRSVTAFAKPLAPEEEIEQAIAVLSQTPLRVRADSERAEITDCIQIGTSFKIEARATAWHALLRFDSADPAAGDYELHISSQRHHEVGRVQAVTSIEGQDRYLHQYALIASFPTRYVVMTKDSRGTLQVWLVGILEARQFALEEVDADEYG